MWKVALALGVGIGLLEVFLRLTVDAGIIALTQIVYVFCAFGAIC